MENNNVVNDPLTTEQSPEDNNQEFASTEEGQKPVLAGDKTPPNELLHSLQEERDKRRASERKAIELEEELKQLKNTSTSFEDEVFSDEGKTLENKIKLLDSQLVEIKNENAKKDLQISNPTIKEHWADFEEYQSDPENKGMSLKTAAKAFMVEKGLLDTRRTGLERPTGGEKTVSTKGKMTSADVELLRKTNFRKYMDMLTKDQIHIQD